MESDLNKDELAFLTGEIETNKPEKTDTKSSGKFKLNPGQKRNAKSQLKNHAKSEQKRKLKNTDKSTVKNKAKIRKKNKGTGLFDDIGRSEKLERFTIDLPPDLAQKFKDIAKARNIPRAKLLRAIMKRAFDDMQ